MALGPLDRASSLTRDKSCTFKRPVMFHKMNVKNGIKDLKKYPQISRRVRDTLCPCRKAGPGGSCVPVRDLRGRTSQHTSPVAPMGGSVVRTTFAATLHAIRRRPISWLQLLLLLFPANAHHLLSLYGSVHRDCSEGPNAKSTEHARPLVFSGDPA